MIEKNKHIDLHSHSTFSDGVLDVEELLKLAEEKKLASFAITDHDNFESIKYIENNNTSKLYSGQLIPAAEIKCVFNGELIEVLAYNIPYSLFAKDEYFSTEYAETRNEKLMKDLINKFIAYGFKIDEHFIVPKTKEPKVGNIIKHIKTFKENLPLLKKFGISFGKLFYRRQVLKRGSMFYCDYNETFPTLEYISSKVRAAGGTVIAAHCFGVYCNPRPKEFIKSLAESKMVDGFECIHSEFTDAEVDWLTNYCDKNHLLKTGGSDFHNTEYFNSSIYGPMPIELGKASRSGRKIIFN